MPKCMAAVRAAGKGVGTATAVRPSDRGEVGNGGVVSMPCTHVRRHRRGHAIVGPLARPVKLPPAGP